MEKINWTDLVRDEEVIQRAKEERNILRTMRRKGNWIGHNSCRNCLLKHVIDATIEGRSDGRTRKKTEEATG